MSDDLVGNFRPLLNRLPAAADLVLAVLIGLAAARLFWLLWPAGDVRAPVVAAEPAAAAAQPVAIDVDRIAAVDLFGTPAATGDSDASAQQVINAPETQLNLTLTGIVSNRNGGESRALIKDAHGDQEPYAVGDSVADNVKLHAIYTTRVILDRGGRYETLTLEREKIGNNVQRFGNRRGQNHPVGGPLSKALSNVRQEILQRPSRLTHYLRLQPALRNGKLLGYRVYPGQDRQLFQRAGLRPGELVTRVNGVSLTNRKKALQLLGDLARAPSITVTVERGGQQRTMSVNFQ